MQIDVVGHDDSAHDPHGLLQLHGPATFTVRQEHALQQLPLVRLRHHILSQARRQRQTCNSATNIPTKRLQKRIFTS